MGSRGEYQLGMGLTPIRNMVAVLRRYVLMATVPGLYFCVLPATLVTGFQSVAQGSPDFVQAHDEATATDNQSVERSEQGTEFGAEEPTQQERRLVEVGLRRIALDKSDIKALILDHGESELTILVYRPSCDRFKELCGFKIVRVTEKTIEEEQFFPGKIIWWTSLVEMDEKRYLVWTYAPWSRMVKGEGGIAVLPLDLSGGRALSLQAVEYYPDSKYDNPRVGDDIATLAGHAGGQSLVYVTTRSNSSWQFWRGSVDKGEIVWLDRTVDDGDTRAIKKSPYRSVSNIAGQPLSRGELLLLVADTPKRYEFGGKRASIRLSARDLNYKKGEWVIGPEHGKLSLDDCSFLTSLNSVQFPWGGYGTAASCGGAFGKSSVRLGNFERESYPATTSEPVQGTDGDFVQAGVPWMTWLTKGVSADAEVLRSISSSKPEFQYVAAPIQPDTVKGRILLRTDLSVRIADGIYGGANISCDGTGDCAAVYLRLNPDNRIVLWMRKMKLEGPKQSINLAVSKQVSPHGPEFRQRHNTVGSRR